jgi:imidazole glycerol-phosphate synthase subunit HisH
MILKKTNSQICILKSNFANLYSVYNALLSLGFEAIISDNSKDIQNSDILIFPGVGSFAPVKKEIDEKGLSSLIQAEIQKGKLFLGICLGMQILFEKSSEGLGVEGLGIFKGEVLPLDPEKVSRIPHIGWNELNIQNNFKSHSIFNSTENPAQVYFVHSYFCSPLDEKQIVATTEAGINYQIPVMVNKDNVYGMQFHPERSGKTGLLMLKNFLNLNN